MSEQVGEPDPAAIELAPSGDAGFAQLMDALAPEDEGGSGGAAAAPVGAEAPAGDAPGGGGDAAAGQQAAGDGADGGAAAAPAGGEAAADGGAGGAAAPGADGAADGGAAGDAATSGGGARPDAWTATAESFAPQLGELSTKLEENTQNAYRAEALKEVQTEHERYFTMLQKHPRLLVGTQVPAIGKDGMETLSSTQDAKDWQDAVKSILVEEVQSRASVKLDENRDFLNTVHASIDLFKNNRDLIPGTKDFDVDLANRFATFAKPYELRVEGKLQGYSVPVQPIIDQLREQVLKERQTAAAAAPAAPAAAGGASTPPSADPPQAGVTSKAGSGGEQPENFDALFGTIGLSGMRF